MSTDPDRDPALAALWREHSTETPPPHVDAAILAAAHRAVSSAPQVRERWLGPRAWRWLTPLAAAAVIAVVVVGVKPPSQTLVDDAVQSATDMTAATAEKQIAEPKPEAKAAAVPESKVAATPEPEPDVATAPGEQSASAPKEERGRSETPRVAQSAVSERQQPAPAAPDASALRERAKPDTDRVQAFATPPARAAASIAAPPPARAAGSIEAPAQPASPAGAAAGGSSTVHPESNAPAARDDRTISLAAEDWIARIRALLERGSQDEALRELARFRAAQPDADARLPADLREWAKTAR